MILSDPAFSVNIVRRVLTLLFSKKPYKMKTALIIALPVFTFLAIVVNAEESQNAMARTVVLENENDGLGEYKFKFITSNEIERSESGHLEDDGNYVVQGYYSFVADDGKKYYVTYVADKTGYHPTVIDSEPPVIEGEIIPQVPLVESLPQSVVASLLGG